MPMKRLSCMISCGNDWMHEWPFSSFRSHQNISVIFFQMLLVISLDERRKHTEKRKVIEGQWSLTSSSNVRIFFLPLNVSFPAQQCLRVCAEYIGVCVCVCVEYLCDYAVMECIEASESFPFKRNMKSSPRYLVLGIIVCTQFDHLFRRSFLVPHLTNKQQ